MSEQIRCTIQHGESEDERIGRAHYAARLRNILLKGKHNGRFATAEEREIADAMIELHNLRSNDLLVEHQSILATLRQLYEAIPDNEGGELGTACRDARAMLAKYDITVW